MSREKVRARGLWVDIKERFDTRSPNGSLHLKPLAKGKKS
jgi:hypothetical protein